MKKILHNFQWNLPSKMRKRDDQTLKTSSYEILFWGLRRVSLAIVTYVDHGPMALIPVTFDNIVLLA